MEQNDDTQANIQSPESQDQGNAMNQHSGDSQPTRQLFKTEEEEIDESALNVITAMQKEAKPAMHNDANSASKPKSRRTDAEVKRASVDTAEKKLLKLKEAQQVFEQHKAAKGYDKTVGNRYVTYVAWINILYRIPTSYWLTTHPPPPFFRQAQYDLATQKVCDQEQIVATCKKDAENATKLEISKKVQKEAKLAKHEPRVPFSQLGLQQLVRIRLTFQDKMDNKIDKNANIWQHIEAQYKLILFVLHFYFNNTFFF